MHRICTMLISVFADILIGATQKTQWTPAHKGFGGPDPRPPNIYLCAEKSRHFRVNRAPQEKQWGAQCWRGGQIWVGDFWWMSSYVCMFSLALTHAFATAQGLWEASLISSFLGAWGTTILGDNAASESFPPWRKIVTKKRQKIICGSYCSEFWRAFKKKPRSPRKKDFHEELRAKIIIFADCFKKFHK